MKNFLHLLQTLDYMRLALGMIILVNGQPLIFFFRDALHLAPGSTTFTAAAFAGGLVLMVPFTLLRRLYRPNLTMLWMGLGFLAFSMLYMFVYIGGGSFTSKDIGRDLIYYIYILMYLFLLINIPNDIIRVFIPIMVIFTLVSNFGLLYSLLTDPTWVVGKRATITLNNSDEGSGNPHTFSRNAFMGVIACAIWLLQSNTSIIFRLLAFFAGVFNIVVLVLTQTRSAILALIVAFALFIYFNVRPAQIRHAVRQLLTPVPITIAVIGFIGVLYLIQRYSAGYAILYGYYVGFVERNLENIYALLGMNVAGTAYQATLDDSAAYRGISTLFFLNVLEGHMQDLILGYGYKYLYLDVPILEALTSQGILGFILFGGLNALIVYHVLGVMRRNPNPLSIFLAYFYMLVLVQLFTNGRPYDISFWFPLALMIRFMGVDHLFPAYLSNQPEERPSDSIVVVPSPA